MNVSLSEDQLQFLDKVNHCINQILEKEEAELPSSAEVLLAASRHLCVTDNAKRIRPLVSLFFSDALHLDNDQMVSAAAAVELMHSASLLHDDVIDDAKIRRGRTTVSYQQGNSVAVLAGNHLLTNAFSLLKTSPRGLIEDAIDAVRYMAKAAIAEISIRSRTDIDINCWREIALGKTGALFAWSGRAAARIAGNEEAVDKFYQCGLHIGTAFQLVDDLRDLYDKKELKDRFSDIRNKEPSYPIIQALKSADIKQELVNLWSDQDLNSEKVEFVGQMILTNGAWEETCEAIKKEVNSAKDSLGHFIETSGGLELCSWLDKLYFTADNGFK